LQVAFLLEDRRIEARREPFRNSTKALKEVMYFGKQRWASVHSTTFAHTPEIPARF